MTEIRKQFRIVKTGKGVMKIDPTKLHEVRVESNPGTSVDGNYTFEQTTPSSTWHITHPLQKYPSVTVIDSAGTQVEGDVKYPGKSKVEIYFNFPFSGIATLN